MKIRYIYFVEKNLYDGEIQMRKDIFMIITDSVKLLYTRYEDLLLYGLAGIIIIGGTSFAGPILVIPIILGIVGIYLKIINGEKSSIKDLVSFFETKEKFMSSLLTMILAYAKILFGFLLLIIPGIIKCLEYALVPFILNDKRFNYKYDEALEYSKSLMLGNKLRLLGLYLIIYLVLGIVYVIVYSLIFLAINNLGPMSILFMLIGVILNLIIFLIIIIAPIIATTILYNDLSKDSTDSVVN